jgi:hypothetical protein
MDINLGFVLVVALICASIVGLFFIENNKPLCTMQMGINADINLQTDLISNVSINNISITAPCGEDLKKLYDNSFKRFA